MDFHGKTVVITGGAGGIGRAAADIMGRQGASLFISDVGTEAGEAAVAHWRSRGIAAQFRQADLTDLSKIRTLSNQCELRLPGTSSNRHDRRLGR